MRKVRAFTLVELLVVVAIIALLLAVLIPSLNKARELAKRIVCSNHVHTFGVANSMYETTYGVYIPIAFDTWLPPQYSANQKDFSIWFSNRAFRRFLSVDSYRSVGKKNDSDNADSSGNVRLLDAPKEFTCPSDKISKYRTNISQDFVLVSYGYNFTDWVEEAWPSLPDDFYGGYGPGAVKNPAEKLTFIDAPDWWVQWRYADYEAFWDKYGEQTIDFYKDELPSDRADGPVFYRHDDGANVGFYDGHVEYMKKWNIFVVDDFLASPKRPGMWSIKSTLRSY